MPRPKAFDPADKVREAMMLFWTDGFATTSIPVLERHLKINRFSIYDTYGDKRALFVAALKQYTKELEELLLEPLENGTRGLADLRDFFRKFEKKFGEPGEPRGCLLANTASELGNRDPEIGGIVWNYFTRVEKAFFTSLKRARNVGEVDGGDASLRHHARLLRSTAQGILVELRLVDDVARVRPAFAAVEAYVRNLKSGA